MTKLTTFTEINGRKYGLLVDRAQSLAIPLAFNHAQPRHFNAEMAQSSPMLVEGFVGDTRQGGSCNVSRLSLNPHCNGTHTECVGHIVDDDVSIDSCLPFALLESTLITIAAKTADQVKNEVYTPKLHKNDLVLSREALETALKDHQADFLKALIVRTSPNHEHKKTMQYSCEQTPAFFTNSALELILQLGIEHLLVDIPSIDRMHDQGFLSNHHLFWQRERGQSLDPSRCFKTITEMIFVGNDLEDGSYLLNLQIPAFVSDAAPSRPILIPVEAL